MTDIKKLARLANLTLTPEEESRFAGQLDETLTHLRSLEEIDTSNIDPRPVHSLTNVWREDKVRPSLTQSEALGNAKQTKDGYFVVERILG